MTNFGWNFIWSKNMCQASFSRDYIILLHLAFFSSGCRFPKSNPKFSSDSVIWIILVNIIVHILNINRFQLLFFGLAVDSSYLNAVFEFCDQYHSSLNRKVNKLHIHWRTTQSIVFNFFIIGFTKIHKDFLIWMVNFVRKS